MYSFVFIHSGSVSSCFACQCVSDSEAVAEAFSLARSVMETGPSFDLVSVWLAGRLVVTMEF